MAVSDDHRPSAPLQVVKLKRDWPKGYSRIGAAYSGLKQWQEAIEAYEQGGLLQNVRSGLGFNLTAGG